MFWTAQKAFYRTYHGVMKVGIPVMPFPVPELITGPGAIKELANLVAAQGLDKVLVVTDKGLTATGLPERLLASLKDAGVAYAVFDGVQPNPTIQNVEDGLQLYQTERCEGIIAFGGGSPMDCAKIIGARAANPKKSVLKMRGMFRVWKKPPPLFAVPTTAGTGSETTVAAVISDPDAREKFVILDLKLVPTHAVLDPELMLGLPPHITATTGMDALTHAVEAYIGLHGTRFTNENAEKATRLIFEHLEAVFKDGSDLERRYQMALASFYAGSAFTRASVGYVHALAHNLGGFYGVPHGLANGVILPYVLEFSRPAAEKKLARLARAGGIGVEADGDEKLSFRFIEKVKALNRSLEIPTFIQELKAADIPLIAERVLKEANPAYPVPRIMTRAECEALLQKLLG